MSTAESTSDAAFASTVARYHADSLRRRPTSATVLGDHTHDDKLEDFSLAAREAEVAVLKRYRLELEAFDPATLTPVHAADREWLLATMGGIIDEATVLLALERNPDMYPSALTASAFSIVNRDFAPLPVRARALIGRMKQMPAVLLEAERNLDAPPRVYTEIALAQIDGNRDFFATTVTEAFADLDDAGLMQELHAARDAVIAAFHRYETFLRDDVLGRSTGDFALGADAFSRKLYHDELIELPLATLLDIGEADLRRNQAELASLATQIDPDSTLAEVLATLGRDHIPADALLATTRAMLAEIRDFIAERALLTMPEAHPVKVVETPPFMRATVSAAMDTPGVYETVSTEAFYYMTLPNPAWPAAEQEAYMAQWTSAGVSNLSVHEAYPGHYVQFLLLDHFPTITRRIMWAPSNAEGWAHYCEQMMLDEGFRSNAPRYRLAMLLDALLRNTRLVAGIKLHTGQMTVSEAQVFFESEGHLAKPVAQAEAWRGTMDPTYGYYTLGKLMVMKLRADYAEQRGAAFSLKEFHDAFLAHGPLPLPLIREAMLGSRDGLL